MAKCPNCGAKIGWWTNQADACGECETEFCFKCAPLLAIKVGRLPKPAPEERWHTETLLCSDNCAYKQFLHFEEEIEEGRKVSLTNECNVGVSVKETRDGDYFRYLSFSPWHKDEPGDCPEPNLIPEMVPIYEMINKDLKSKGRDHEEIFSNKW